MSFLSQFKLTKTFNSSITNEKFKVYKYAGTGYFPEVVNRLRNEVEVAYLDYSEELVHIKEAN